ncbi:MAG: DUF4920 domain-containing protein [Rhodothermales bacterium]|nr:DUF4920 domain-containing protein [Rhodothermales bacterium]MBO6779105.1 DUF4920 domain-containing protein [Rhodothermales bacterium]
MKSLIPAFLILLAGCVGDHSQEYDVLTGYDSFGEAITPEDAVPVSAVIADGPAMIGHPVKLEGRISEVCEMAGCWLSMQVIDGPMVRVDVPRDENGAYVFTFPKDASGRRAVISGVLQGDVDHHGDAAMAHHDSDAGEHHAEGDSDAGEHHDGGDHDSAGHHAEGDSDGHDQDLQGHSEQETRVLNESAYTLTARGALIERVRA